jgi:hypothetical protein
MCILRDLPYPTPLPPPLKIYLLKESKVIFKLLLLLLLLLMASLIGPSAKNIDIMDTLKIIDYVSFLARSSSFRLPKIWARGTGNGIKAWCY